MGINKDLGLPFGDGMEKVAIAFDVDGTLIDENEKLITSTAILLLAFLGQEWKNVDIIIWSGGGKDYARTMVQRHIPQAGARISFFSKLEWKVLKPKYAKIIAIDDVQDTRLGDINLIVRNK